MKVTVWSHANCEACELAVVELKLAGIPYQRKYLAQTPQLTERLAQLGIPDLPAIEAGEIVWVGNRPEMVARLADAIRRQHGS